MSVVVNFSFIPSHSATRLYYCSRNGSRTTEAGLQEGNANGSAMEENVRQFASVLCKRACGRQSS